MVKVVEGVDTLGFQHHVRSHCQTQNIHVNVVSNLLLGQ